MSIIISKQGQIAQKLEKADFEKEDYLQNYIHENPESIPVYEIEEDKKLLVVAREFPTESGPIDALAIDRDGDLYIVETKLFKNPDKRTVVAQALDYGASLWKHTNDFAEFIKRVDSEIQSKFHVTLEEKAKDFFGVEDVSSMLDRMESNLKDGNIKFVILMDSINERLKDLIIYVNQNSQFDIYAVQLEYYKFNDYEIMIPKLFGVEVKKNIKTGSNSARFTWTREALLDSINLTIKDDNTRNTTLELFNFTNEHADKTGLGSGNAGSFTFKFKDARPKSGLVSLFTVYSDGNKSSLQLGFGNIKSGLGEEYPKLYWERLSRLEFIKEWKKEDLLGGNSPCIYVSDAFKDKDALERFKTVILEFVKEVKM